MKPVKRVQVEVTAEDIRLGVCGNPGMCAIARAVNRDFGSKAGFAENVFVTESEVTMWVGDERLEFTLPKKASKFVVDFDTDRKRVQPITFTMEAL